MQVLAISAWMAVVAVALPGMAGADEQLAAGSSAARAVDGAKISADWCDTCHMVRNEGQGRDVAPPFAVIGAQRSPEQIRAFLSHPHGAMPPIDLSNGQIDDIIAYMQSLQPQ